MGLSRQQAMLLLICLTSAGWAVSFGLGATLASLWLDQAGERGNAIGWNHCAYYLGMALAALIVPGLMRRWGSGCIVVGMVGSALTTALFPCGDGLTGWFLMRLTSGMAGALCLIPLETYVNLDAPPEHRSRNFGCYALSIALGYALGSVIGLVTLPWLHAWTFMLGGFSALVSALAVWRWLHTSPVGEEDEDSAGQLSWRRNFLSYAAAWNQGFLEGGMIAFMALYLLWLGFTEVGVSWITGATLLGIILTQVPMAWLADRLGQKKMLVFCHLATLLALFVVPQCGPTLWLGGLLFLVGVSSGAFYPLGLALLGKNVPATVLPKANAWYLAIECLGCLSGPVVMGYALDWWGRSAIFTVSQAVLGGGLLVWLALELLERGRPTRRAEPVAEDSSARAA